MQSTLEKFKEMTISARFGKNFLRKNLYEESFTKSLLCHCLLLVPKLTL